MVNKQCETCKQYADEYIYSKIVGLICRNCLDWKLNDCIKIKGISSKEKIKLKQGMKVRIDNENIEGSIHTLKSLDSLGNWYTMEGYFIDPSEVLEIIVDDDFSGRVIDRGFNPEMITIPTSEYKLLKRVFDKFTSQ